MSRVPRIRFKGFEEDWEQRKLGEICQITMGQSPDGSTYSETPSDYILVQGNADLKDGWVYPRIWTTQKTKMADAGDLIMSVRAPAGTMGKTYYDVVIGRGVAGIKGSEFIYQTLVKMDSDGYWKILAAGSTFESINSDVVNGAEIMVTENIDEQNKIGDYLASIDHLITLHQRKLEKLKIIKKSMLENLFPQNEEKTPKIRFSGFTKDWEQRKVNEIIEDYIEKTTIQNQYTVLTSSQQKGIVYQEEYFSDRQVTTNENIGYYVLPRGYFTYRSRSDTNVFVFNRNDIIDKGIISYYYPVFFNKNSDSNFLLRRLNTGIERQIIMAAEGTGQHVLAHSKFKNMDIFVPYLDEQKRIGKYFESLDHLITLHQSKLDKLQKIKKSMLESMFV